MENYFSDAPGLPRGVSRFAANKRWKTISRMPRACPVEAHVLLLTRDGKVFSDATGLPRGGSRFAANKRWKTISRMPRACPVEYHVLLLTRDGKLFLGCHGLVPWSITF